MFFLQKPRAQQKVERRTAEKQGESKRYEGPIITNQARERGIFKYPVFLRAEKIKTNYSERQKIKTSMISQFSKLLL